MNLNKTARVDASSLNEMKNFISDSKDPKFFFTMTNVNKIGINPQPGYENPLGVYSYPLIDSTFNKLIKGNLPFQGGAPYIKVFTISKPIFNFKNYSEVDYKRDTSAIREMYFEKGESGDKVFEKYMLKTLKPVRSFWNLCRKVAEENPLKWNIILRNLGYYGFYDPGTATISSTIQLQALILDPSIIIEVKTFINPMRLKEVDEFSNETNLSKEEKAIFNHKREVDKKLNMMLEASRTENISAEEKIKIFNIVSARERLNENNSAIFNKQFEIAKNIAKSDPCPPEIQYKILDTDNKKLINILASNPSCLEELQIQLIKTNDPTTLITIFDNISSKKTIKKSIIFKLFELYDSGELSNNYLGIFETLSQKDLSDFEEAQIKLINFNNNKINKHLSDNTSCSPEVRKQAYDKLISSKDSAIVTNNDQDSGMIDITTDQKNKISYLIKAISKFYKIAKSL